MSPYMPILHPSYFLAFETLSVIAIAIILVREIWRKNYMRTWEVIACAVFGMILEIGDTSFYHSYSYSSQFILQIAGVPVAIGIGWAAIIYCAMLLSDQYDVPWGYRPLMDALTALTLDISMDIVAIRMGFWTWDIPLNHEWYGVPYENLAGWIFVTLSFSFLVRYIRRLNVKRLSTKALMLATPFLAYVGLLAQFSIFSVLAFIPYGINNWTAFVGTQRHSSALLNAPEASQWKLILLVVLIMQLVNLVVFAIASHRQRPNPKLDIISFGMLSSIHAFFLFALFQTGIYRQIPIAVLIGFVAFIVHCVVHVLPWFLSPARQIYAFETFRLRAVSKGERLHAHIVSAFK